LASAISAPVKLNAKSEQTLAKHGERCGFAELNVRAQNPMSGENEALLQPGASGGDPALHSRGINGEFIPGSHSW
jgi:hypothetical protein